MSVHLTLTEGMGVGIAVGAVIVGTWAERRLTAKDKKIRQLEARIVRQDARIASQSERIKRLTAALEDVTVERDTYLWHAEVDDLEERAAHPAPVEVKAAAPRRHLHAVGD